MEKEEIYQKALSLWGIDTQIKMVFEEMAELQKELCKYFRSNRSPNTLANIREEIADVEIMLAQMKYIFDREGTEIENIKIKKLEQLESRILEEYESKRFFGKRENLTNT